MLLDIYGEVMECRGDRTLVPFRYQGQYEDMETGLYYNRFRYYSPRMGMYISSDHIGLEGNNPTLYGYVKDVNTWPDPWGLKCKTPKDTQKAIKRGQGPLEIDRIDKPMSEVPGSQWHAHGKGKNSGAIIQMNQFMIVILIFRTKQKNGYASTVGISNSEFQQ